ncbi:hypothetical protein F5880DRAFT_1618680 [Lentinula raphanica]|nr:hypothetical protein F5880DRAFT_1618680 [Lentinula raphanica]
MPVIALTDAEDSEGSTFTQGNVAVPQSISTFKWSSVSGRSPQGFLESSNFKQDWSSTPVPSRSSIDVSDNSASIWVLEFVGAATTRRVHNSRKVQPSQDHQMFEADALRIMAGVFDVSYQKVYRDGLQLQGSFGADTDVISSFKVKVTTAPPELKNVLQLPCDVSVDIIGLTVAVANFGNGRYIFLGLHRVFSNESRYSKSIGR